MATQSTFWGLEITKTGRGFEVRNSRELVEPLLRIFTGLKTQNRLPNPGGRCTVMELATAIPLDGHDYSNFRTAIGKLIFMAPWRTDMQFDIQQQSNTSPQLPHQRASAQ